MILWGNLPNNKNTELDRGPSLTIAESKKNQILSKNGFSFGFQTHHASFSGACYSFLMQICTAKMSVTSCVLCAELFICRFAAGQAGNLASEARRIGETLFLGFPTQ